jgi:hypothetical protein
MQFYKASIIAYNMDTGKHKVQYQESLFVEELHLPVELVHFDDDKPVAVDVTAQEAAAAAEAIKRGDASAADEETERLSRAVMGEAKRR